VRDRRETVVAWLVILGLVVVMLVRAALAFRMYGDRPRTWQYRTAPYIPAETYASTQPAPRGAAPKQVTLPPSPAKPKEKAK